MAISDADGISHALAIKAVYSSDDEERDANKLREEQEVFKRIQPLVSYFKKFVAKRAYADILREAYGGELKALNLDISKVVLLNPRVSFSRAEAVKLCAFIWQTETPVYDEKASEFSASIRDEHGPLSLYYPVPRD